MEFKKVGTISLLLIFLIGIFGLSSFAQGEGETGVVENNTNDLSPPEPIPISEPPVEIQNTSQDIPTVPPQEGIVPSETQPTEPTIPVVELITNFSIASIVPRETKTGDTQFSIQVQNTGTTDLHNVAILVSGYGVSTYDTIPIDTLRPGEKSYVIVMANVREGGNIRLTLKMFDPLFY